MKDGFKKIGVIGVDAGLCWIGDPCYIMHVGRDSKETPERNALEWTELQKSVGASWHEFCDKVHGNEEMKKGVHWTQFKYSRGHDGLGVCVSTGWGDGSYDVYAKMENGRVSQVLIDFEGEFEGNEGFGDEEEKGWCEND